jgi:DNA polymerase-3 subunit delta'
LLNIEKIYDSLPWLDEQRQQLIDLVAADRCAHALLIQGAEGSGRRHLALWLATELLGMDPSRALDSDPEAEVGHPDFRTVEVLSDKTRIGIDQIRGLIEFINLTSYSSKAKVVVIYPADTMVVNAANALLKTLEEPPANTFIILICESLTRLPATIVSRCQRVRIPPPPEQMALAWLADNASGKDLATMLAFSGGAPLATLALHEADFSVTANQYAADLKSLESCQISPVVIAERWAKKPKGVEKGEEKKQLELALQWLYWRLSRRVHASLEALAGNPSDEMSGGSLQTGQIQQTMQACFRQMAQIRELRRLIKGGINAELNLAGLLMDWYGGLGHQ